MKSGTELVYRLNHDPYMLWVHVRPNPVTKIENMATPLAITLKDLSDLGTQCLGRSIKGLRVEIALKRHPIADPAAGIAYLGCPV
jgi:hypothetical protein